MSVNEVKIQPAPFDLEVRGTGHPSSRTYAIGDEDHTLGNALRHVLMKNQKVDFAGYSVPHPSEPVVHIRVQTSRNSKKLHNIDSSNDRNNDNNDDLDEESSKLPATEVLKEACETLIAQCEIVLDQLEETMPEVKKDRIELEDLLKNEGYDDGDDNNVDVMDEGGLGEEEVYDDDMMM